MTIKQPVFLSFPIFVLTIAICVFCNAAHAQTYLNDNDTPQFVDSIYIHNNSDSGSMTDLGYADLRLLADVQYASVELTNDVEVLPEAPIQCSCAGAQEAPSQILAAYYSFQSNGSFDGIHSGILLQFHQGALCTFPVSRTAFLGVVTPHVDFQDCLYQEQISPILPRFRYIDKIRQELMVRENPTKGWPPGPLCLSCPPHIALAPMLEKFSEQHKLNIKSKLPTLKKQLSVLERSLR